MNLNGITVGNFYHQGVLSLYIKTMKRVTNMCNDYWMLLYHVPSSVLFWEQSQPTFSWTCHWLCQGRHEDSQAMKSLAQSHKNDDPPNASTHSILWTAQADSIPSYTSSSLPFGSSWLSFLTPKSPCCHHRLMTDQECWISPPRGPRGPIQPITYAFEIWYS